MKKIMFIMLWLAGVATAFSQTQFRNITYNEAFDVAKREKKFVFVDFYTTWCGPCKKMLNEVFPQKKVGDFMNDKFVCIKIDGESEIGRKLTKEFHVMGYPTFVVLTPDGQLMKQIVGAQDADKFLGVLNESLDLEKTPSRMKERYEAGERTADLVAAYAKYTLGQAFITPRPNEQKRKEAYAMVLDYFDGLTDVQRVLPENKFMYIDFTNDVEDPKAVYMTKNRNRFPVEIRSEVNKQIEFLYNRKVLMQMMGSNLENDNVQKTKKDLDELGLNKDGKYDSCLELIDSYKAGDIEAYLNLCEQKYDLLTNEQKEYMMYGLSNWIPQMKEQNKKHATSLLRSKLTDMHYNLLPRVSNILRALDNGNDSK